ncbi:hypothetical protein [Oxalobacter paraformigenes]|uniref:hypothetical protein n=1 Tax=Oxalobacter paraformigenes TaxID=556268 RepID=UPI0005945D15|nr:hypothetical protein [Oxalobacter paraformigenes]
MSIELTAAIQKRNPYFRLFQAVTIFIKGAISIDRQLFLKGNSYLGKDEIEHYLSDYATCATYAKKIEIILFLTKLAYPSIIETCKSLSFVNEQLQKSIREKIRLYSIEYKMQESA